MKSLGLMLGLLSFAATAYAVPVAECRGTSDLDNSPVIARVYSDNGHGKIIIQTSIDSIESPAKVESLDGHTWNVSENAFEMSFSASQSSPAFPVVAFRGGEFFVDDFSCIAVN